jgi:hypothetical protein
MGVNIVDSPKPAGTVNAAAKNVPRNARSNISI